MIVAVKRNRKQKLIRILSLVVVAGLFVWYYNHMSNQFAQEEKEKKEKLQATKIQEEKHKANKKRLEKAILSEVEKAVDLVGQEYIRNVKIIEDKVVIICEPETNLEALKVRYGSMALVKKTLNEVLIAINIKYIVESRLNDK